MGSCVGGPREPSNTRIIQQINRIKLVSSQEQLRWQREYHSQQQLLKKDFLKEVHFRNKGVEHAEIGRIVYGMNMSYIYKLIEGECKKLIDYKTLLEKEETLSSVKQSIDLLLYCSAFLNNQQLSHFYFLIKSRYPKYADPLETDIKSEIVRHHRETQDATPKMEYEYIMEFCQNNNFPLEKINEVGHNYRYGNT